MKIFNKNPNTYTQHGINQSELENFNDPGGNCSTASVASEIAQMPCITGANIYFSPYGNLLVGYLTISLFEICVYSCSLTDPKMELTLKQLVEKMTSMEQVGVTYSGQVADCNQLSIPVVYEKLPWCAKNEQNTVIPFLYHCVTVNA